MSATFATLGRVAFDGTPAIVSASDFHRGMRWFCYFEWMSQRIEQIYRRPSIALERVTVLFV
jgi:hypothetical protein